MKVLCLSDIHTDIWFTHAVKPARLKVDDPEEDVVYDTLEYIWKEEDIPFNVDGIIGRNRRKAEIIRQRGKKVSRSLAQVLIGIRRTLSIFLCYMNLLRTAKYFLSTISPLKKNRYHSFSTPTT